MTSFTYDSAGNLRSVIRDAGIGRFNQLTQMSYDPVGDVTVLTGPNGNATTSAYDADRRVTSVTTPPLAAAPGGLVTSYAYDPDGRPLQTRQLASGVLLRTTSTAYTLTGKMASQTDANGNTTQYAYGGDDHVAR